VTQRTQANQGAQGTPEVAIIDIWAFEVEVEPTLADVDLAGFTVEGRDGKIGKVDEDTREAGGNFLIVDTGPPILGKKVILPAGVVERVDPESKTVFVSLTKDEIKNAPEYEEETGHRDEGFRRRLSEYYERLKQRAKRDR
jgi:hypothetical protein